MSRRQPRTTRNDTLIPNPPLFRSQVDDVGQGEVEGDAADPRRVDRVDSDGDDLARRGDAVAADQFGADLQHLARRAKLARAQLDHLPRTADAKGAWRLRGPRGRGAAGLRSEEHRMGKEWDSQGESWW